MFRAVKLCFKSATERRLATVTLCAYWNPPALNKNLSRKDGRQEITEIAVVLESHRKLLKAKQEEYKQRQNKNMIKSKGLKEKNKKGKKNKSKVKKI